MTNPLPFLTWPDGSDVLSERFTETTALATAYDGTESATICRAFPRYGIAAAFILFDGEQDTLGELEAGRPVLVPAWMHPMPAREGGTPPLVDVIHGPGPAKLFAIKDANGYISPLTSPVSGEIYALANTDWLPNYRTAFPLLPMRLDSDSFDITVQAPGASTTSLAFITDALDEPLPAYTGPTSQGLPLLVLRAGWAAKPALQTAFSVNSFDVGNLATVAIRHRKRSIGISFDLWGRAEILAFRLFFRQLRGRAGRFRWKSFDGIERTYRLAGDTWDLKYTGSHTAACSLRFVEI